MSTEQTGKKPHMIVSYIDIGVPCISTALARRIDNKASKCLQIFVARYRNYSKHAVNELKNLIDKYTYISLYAQTICGQFLGEAETEERRQKNVEIVRSIKVGLELLDDLPDRPNNTICAREFNKTTWIMQAETMAKQVIDEETKRLQPRTWNERQDLHKAVANGIVVRLNNSTYKKKHYSFMALAYLPYRTQDQRYFIQNSSDIFAKEYNLVNYIVARYRTNTSSELRNKWDIVYERRKAILDATFPLDAYDLEERIGAVQSRLESGVIGTFLSGGGFKALAVLRCGYEFVWYELGYRYFPAGYSTGNYTLTTEENEYSSKCGQIVLFP